MKTAHRLGQMVCVVLRASLCAACLPSSLPAAAAVPHLPLAVAFEQVALDDVVDVGLHAQGPSYALPVLDVQRHREVLRIGIGIGVCIGIGV